MSLLEVNWYYPQAVDLHEGKVVFDWYVVLIQAISKEYWKLKALDILESLAFLILNVMR
jgi:hypothetical protein